MKKPEHIHRVRLVQLVFATLIALAVFTVKMYLEGQTLKATILLSSFVLLSMAPWFARNGRQHLASMLLISIVSGALLLLMWTGSGVKDAAILGLPGVLVFTAMIGALRLFKWFLAIISINILLMGGLVTLGLFPFDEPIVDITAAINSVIIIVVVAYATRMMARDNLQLIDELEQNFNELARAKKEVDHQSLHDPLTGLPNRLNAEQHFSQLLHRLQRHVDEKAGLLYIDLDEFKDINDEFGHETGDQYLVKKSEQLKESLRPLDILCRIGGDEFLILVSETDVGGLSAIAEKVKRVFSKAVEIHEHVLSTTCSIGIVMIPDDADSYELAVKRADIAMYRAKEQGKNQYHFYDDAMEARVHRRLALQNHFLAGLSNQEFSVYLQPIYELNTEQMKGAEALARWQHAHLGAISPTEFIALAESNGFIHDLGYWVLQQVCQQLAVLNSIEPEFYISVNVSPLQLKQTSFVRQLRTCLDSFGVAAKNLKLEITESQFIESDEALAKVIKDIRQLGVGLYLDDFGTGYSNLAQLQKMQFEVIKIDRSFVANCSSDLQKPALLKAIVGLAAELQVQLVAEGVETPEEASLLKMLGVHLGQGYLWQRPMPSDELIETIDGSMSSLKD